MLNRILNGAIVVLVLASLTAAAVYFVGGAASRNPAATLEITSTPEHASVWVNGRFAGVTPVTAEDVPVGETVLRVEKYGYRNLIRRLDLAEGLHAEAVELDELPRGSLHIESVPAGADIFIDGERRGQTPDTISGLATGGRNVRLALTNYLDWTVTVEVESGKTANQKVELKSRTEAAYLAEIRKDPNNIIAYCDLAHYLILQDAWTRAERAFANALVVAARESSASHYTNRLEQEIQKVWGMQFKYSSLEKGRETIARAYIRAINDYPNYQRFYGNAITYASSIGLKDEAQAVVEKGILAFPTNTSWVLETAGRRGRESRDDDRLLKSVEQKIKKDPKDFVSRYQRMVLLQRLGETDEAVKEYETLLPMVKNEPVVTRLTADLARLYERKQDYAKAADAYQKAADAQLENREKAPLCYNLARVYAKLERTDETLEAWKDAVAFQEDVELACRWRLDWAKACIALKAPEEAKRILNETLKLSKEARTLDEAKQLLEKL